MARQNTFTVLPPVPRFNAGVDTPPRPMTSKQVRKAYKAATKTPTMTRAERAKWERAEQERIRKEMDKERAAAKARAAREKKKEKETQQREEKRRNGMPLVNVRPSQDTIARFVRGNGSAKKRDAEGLEVTTPQTAELEKQVDADTTMPEPETHGLGSITEADEDVDDETLASVKTDEQPRANPDDNAYEHNTDAKEKQIIGHNETDDKKSEAPAEVSLYDYDVDLSFEEPIDEATFDAALDLIPVFEAGELPQIQLAGEEKQSKEQAIKEAGILALSQDLLDEDINTDMLEELDELLSGGKTPAKPVAVRPLPSPGQATGNARADVASHKAWPNISSTSPRERTRTSPSQRGLPALPSPRQTRQEPPMATQAILTNVDDFFPTSSEQMRELEEEQEASQQEAAPRPAAPRMQQRSSPSNHTFLGGVANCQSVTKPENGIEDPASEFGSFPSTSHFSLSGCYAASHSKQTASSRRQQQAPLSTPKPPVSEPAAPPAQAPQPTRFFTSSGSREQLSLAMQHSRRSAALEQIQEKERRRQEAGRLMRQATHDDCAQQQQQQPASPIGRRNAKHCNDIASRKATTVQAADKENVQPEMRCSQETEYGGDWVEDAAWDLPLC
ncbi:hypothetical protein ISF_09005 [Cordyceps fumosorosea ARSEF 2679]|uniref:Uncharacterized protein n=1 Tax=Cordyceps fumosorosea (strain ARSEF 2679) TaxID=1081104 RepID=A0A167LJM8_CORFA|nr:hypothetical protein ISF_09005 [Cordyceps fumosorosea ARSEF 2679]OAA53164.1 hypothetical protein ISF_09005 [Cordyceps fumosorosea ARSEF 2679]